MSVLPLLLLWLLLLLLMAALVGLPWPAACVTTDLPALATLAMLVAGIHGSSGDKNVQGEVQIVKREATPLPEGRRGGRAHRDSVARQRGC